MSSHRSIQKNALIRKIVDQLKKRLGPNLRQIILFGSRARRQEREDSDFDVLVLVDKRTRLIEDTVDDIGGDFFCDEGKLASLFVVEERRYRKEKFNPLFMRIREEGIPL